MERNYVTVILCIAERYCLFGSITVQGLMASAQESEQLAQTQPHLVPCQKCCIPRIKDPLPSVL